MKPGVLCLLKTNQKGFLSVFCVEPDLNGEYKQETADFIKVPFDEPVIFLKLLNLGIGLFFFIATQKYAALFLTDVEPICFQ